MGHAVLRTGGRALVSVLAMFAVMSATGASAQEAEQEIQIAPKRVQPAPAKTAPAKAAPAKAATGKAATGAKAAAAAGGDSGPKSAWVKLCEKAPMMKKDKDGNELKDEKQLCLTHHERLDGNTGMVLVSAAVREIEGNAKKSLMIMVPLGMAIPPGLRAAVYSKDDWAKASKNEKIDESKLKPIELRYSLCHPAGCTAETEATPEILAEMSKGGGIMVLAMNASAQPVGFPVPLDGYNEAASGPPVDNKKYAEARSALMKQIRDRQQKLAEEWKANEMKNLPLDAPGAPATTGSTAKAPAAKKQ